MMNKYSRLEEGFTLTETVIAVFILSLGSLLLFIGGQKLFSSFNAVREKQIFLRESMQAGMLLKDSFNEIQIPFWEEYPESGSSNKLLELPYLNGNRDSFLRLSFGEDGLSVERNDELQIVYKNLKNGQFEPVMVDEITAGINIVFFDAHGNAYEYKLLFGSHSLRYGDDNE